MYILKNAWRNITRSKGRNILIGIIIIVISASCAVTLAIRESANKIVKSYVESNPVTAEISMNRNKLMESLRDGDKSQEEMINAFNEIKSITEDEVKTYGDSEYVDSYYYTLSLGVNADGLTEATDSLVKETTTTKTTTSSRSFSGGGLVDSLAVDSLVGDHQQQEKLQQRKQKKYIMKKQLKELSN